MEVSDFELLLFEQAAGRTNTGETSVELMMVAKWLHRDETILLGWSMGRKQ